MVSQPGPQWKHLVASSSLLLSLIPTLRDQESRDYSSHAQRGYGGAGRGDLPGSPLPPGSVLPALSLSRQPRPL